MFAGTGASVSPRILLPRNRRAEADLRSVCAVLRPRILMRDEDRRLGRLEVGIVGERLLDEIVERLRVEQRPPVGRDVAPANEPLCLSSGYAGRCGRRLRRLCSVARNCGRLGRREIGADDACGRQQRREKRKARQSAKIAMLSISGSGGGERDSGREPSGVIILHYTSAQGLAAGKAQRKLHCCKNPACPPTVRARGTANELTINGGPKGGRSPVRLLNLDACPSEELQKRASTDTNAAIPIARTVYAAR